MNLCVFIVVSLLSLLILTRTGSQLVVVGEGEDDTYDVMMKCLDKERHALLHFKAPLQDPFDSLSTWRDKDHDCCQWSGVTCSNQTGHVTQLDLYDYGLGGEIGLSLINLSRLNYLDLSENSFRGKIPKSIGSLTRLTYLDLGYNELNGTIPTSVGSLTRLRYLNLVFNYLYGTIPRSIGSLRELRILDLSSNSLYGTIPPEFGNLTNLQELFLGTNGGCRVMNLYWLLRLSRLEVLQMDGISLAKQNYWVDVILSLKKLSILSLRQSELSQVMYPYSSFLNSSLSINTLDLSYNNLTSSMYRWLFPLTSNKLHDLHLSGNMLDRIAKYLGNLCSLKYLYFYENSFVVRFPDFLTNLSGCTSLTLQKLYAPRSQFSGTLSDEIQNFLSLGYLILSHNQLNGTISEKLWELPRLRYLDVSFNNLRVPSTYHMSSLSHVQYIDMRSCKVGPRFPKWIQTLKNLTHLDLSNNGISDTTLLKFWDMSPSQLKYLNLSSNDIRGKLPDVLSNFAEDSVIDLSSNKFYGPISKVPSTLSSLNLSRNKFSGEISFICQIVGHFLSFLDLSHNSFIGQLPDCLWHFKELQVLNIGHNNLFGRLPPTIGSLVELQVLYLYENNFSGELPLSLSNCTSLKSLNLGDNKFSGNVPVWIGENLSDLYVLILRSNNFFGTIPLELCRLAKLQILDLSMNSLHGTIPSCLTNLTSMVQQQFSQDVDIYKTKRDHRFISGTYVDHGMIEWQGVEREFFSTLKLVKSIDLSSNNLTGQIPHEISDLYDLISLDLSKNALFGEIPPKIGEMKKLLTLDLSRNSFSGRLPSSMSQMTLLNDLDVSFNKLSGRIPSSTQLQSFKPAIYYGNAQLCGPPLTKKCPGDEESKVPPPTDKNERDWEDADELERWFYICGGIGFAIGFWIAFGALLLNRHGRRMFFHLYDSSTDWVYVKAVVFIANLQKG